MIEHIGTITMINTTATASWYMGTLSRTPPYSNTYAR